VNLIDIVLDVAELRSKVKHGLEFWLVLSLCWKRVYDKDTTCVEFHHYLAFNMYIMAYVTTAPAAAACSARLVRSTLCIETI
jgi:hypothetical protein